jgi:hypothetical protein
MVPSTEHTWPQFEDGDVEICLSKDPADRFVLHSVVLALHIPVLKVSLSERWSIGERHTADRNAGPIKWKYHLLFEKDQDSGMLMRVVSWQLQAFGSESNTPDILACCSHIKQVNARAGDGGSHLVLPRIQG